MNHNAKTRGRKEGPKDEKIDKAGEMSFPASDPAASGKATGTEPPRKPVDREAPAITKEQIEQARRGEGHKHHRRG